MTTRIHVAACCDENYVPYAAVMMLSALASTPGTPITFHLINCSISSDSIRKLQDLISKQNSQLEVHQPDDALYRGLPTLRYGEAVYQRINLPEYIPSDIGRIKPGGQVIHIVPGNTGSVCRVLVGRIFFICFKSFHASGQP